MSYCYACGYEFPDDFKVFRTTDCPSCGRDVKVCLNCIFYSPGSHYDCRENVPEAVKEKDKSNFCEYFKLGGKSDGGKTEKKARNARSAFDNLFGNE